MPIFKTTVREEVTRRIVAYVEAPDATAADEWASNAADRLFRQEGQEDVWAEVDRIEPVDTAPDGFKVNAYTPPAQVRP